MKINGENSFELDEEALERILLDSRVRDSKVMVVSVTGEQFGGKSFLLNVLLRYLHNLGNPVSRQSSFNFIFKTIIKYLSKDLIYSVMPFWYKCMYTKLSLNIVSDPM